MVHLSAAVHLLGGLWGLFVLAPVPAAPTPPSMCTPLRTINDSLGHRRRYMKHNFPINYTLRVQADELFRLSNVSRMRPQVEVLLLQRLWFQVNQGLLKKIIRILPERHPSRSYAAELERRFRDAEGVFVESHPVEVFQQELPEAVQDTWDHLTEDPEQVPESRWRQASPKALLDHLCSTMHCLFQDCFHSPQQPHDYCSPSGRRRGRKKPERPEGDVVLDACEEESDL